MSKFLKQIIIALDNETALQWELVIIAVIIFGMMMWMCHAFSVANGGG